MDEMCPTCPGAAVGLGIGGMGSSVHKATAASSSAIPEHCQGRADVPVNVQVNPDLAASVPAWSAYGQVLNSCGLLHYA